MNRVLPILFNTEMVQAILDGRKTATRRVMKQQPLFYTSRKYIFDDAVCPKKWEDCDNIIETYRYQPGDILYVRETWFYEHHMEDRTAGEPDLPNGEYSSRYIYRADYPVNEGVYAYGWKPSIFMPKVAARIWLQVTDVRVERLQDITGKGVLAEGVSNQSSNPSMGRCWENQQRMEFEKVWNSTIKKKDLDCYGWEPNPWVWVIEFERCEKPGSAESEGKVCRI